MGQRPKWSKFQQLLFARAAVEAGLLPKGGGVFFYWGRPPRVGVMDAKGGGFRCSGPTAGWLEDGDVRSLVRQWRRRRSLLPLRLVTLDRIGDPPPRPPGHVTT